MSGKELLIVQGAGNFAAAASDRIAALVEHSVETRGSCSLVLAGGATPRPVYQHLAAARKAPDFPWERIDFYFGDERRVPPGDPESNFRMAEETLFSAAPVPRENIHRMEGEDPDAEGTAARYEALLPARLDVVLLGMGTDGHTASLFPHSPALKETLRRVVPVRGPKPPVERITVTPAALAGARNLVVLVTGAEKAPTVAEALEGPRDPRRLPIQFAAEGLWIVDEAAASRLQTETR
ncbi:MAG: 6-phosphogluconolactonase [Planctomycetota bacterium]